MSNITILKKLGIFYFKFLNRNVQSKHVFPIAYNECK